MYSTKLYKSWEKKQREKYSDLIPMIKEHLNKNMTFIDIGVGPAWIYDFIDLSQARIVGVDPDSEIIEPRKEFIEYHVTEWFDTNEKFDAMICFDTLHLIKEPLKLMNYLKTEGLALISVPKRFRNLLKQFTDNYKVIKEGEVGKEEVDYFILIKAD